MFIKSKLEVAIHQKVNNWEIVSVENISFQTLKLYTRVSCDFNLSFCWDGYESRFFGWDLDEGFEDRHINFLWDFMR